jgi:cyclic beta-1,2-glucan synthetase
LVDALTALARTADQGSDADHLRAEAFRLWQKISPLGRDDRELAARYGLAPHQQPADIYSGPGHEGRGGWSWYTGAAARMLWAAYGLLGIELRDGVPVRGATPSGGLELYEIRVRGERLASGDDQDGTR